ncbi:hypothetical protein H0H87_003447 [Tephrocybe sp. NHM501043]|nr:hypothetical protein H0H87_003447 [Tephrocybe sp. NHM501043]
MLGPIVPQLERHFLFWKKPTHSITDQRAAHAVAKAIPGLWLSVKSSFSTFNTFRTGSSSTLLRHPRTSDSHSTLSTSKGTHRLSSADDELDNRERTRSKKNSETRPGDIDPAGLYNVLTWQVNDLIADSIIGAGGQPAPHPSPLTSSDVLASSLFTKRTGRIYNRTSQRISPKDLLLDKVLPASPIDGSLPWTAPESWGVEGQKTELDAAGAEYESSVDDDFGTAVASTGPALKAAGLDIERPLSFTVPPPDLDLQPPHLAPINCPGKRRRKGGKKRVTPYTVRIYKDDYQFHEATIPLTTTVAELASVLNEKLFIPKHETYRLYVRERGREMLLGMTEKPANIIKRRLEHHGYDANDGIILLRGERLSFLIRFIYRSILFSPDKQLTINSFENVDLEGRTLVAIPIVVHKNAEKVGSLKLRKSHAWNPPRLCAILHIAPRPSPLEHVPQILPQIRPLRPPPPAARPLLQPPLHA